ncbi:MAG: N-acetylglucosamine-6-phosphate deacetylase [Candidatus Neomarinimicrobiota bacterium]|nr:MAG: N-acetylglucosamine-6-phosphate deacetylase [Candidatus Neomarinimicrobiota bacterium]
MMLIRNVRVFHEENPVHVRLESGMVMDVYPADPAEKEGMDGGGHFLVPGFTDLHVHGAGGADFSCGEAEKLIQADFMLTRLGTTSYLATTFYLPDGPNNHLQVLRDLFDSGRCPGMKGIHLEGPFISPEKRGGIQPDRIAPYQKNILEDIMKTCGNALKMMTIAPEIDKTESLIRELKSRDVITSLGHSNATAEETRQALELGVDHVTHICNAMRPIHHRETGPIPEIVNSRASVQIISDGVHLSPRMVRFLASLLGYSRCVCITDGMLSTGLPDGEYVYQGKAFRAQNGEARDVLDHGLIGTSLSVLDIAARFMRYTGCTLEEAVRSVTENPCRVLGTHPFHDYVQTGAVADLLLVDQNLNLHHVWKNGNLVK